MSTKEQFMVARTGLAQSYDPRGRGRVTIPRVQTGQPPPRGWPSSDNGPEPEDGCQRSLESEVPPKVLPESGTRQPYGCPPTGKEPLLSEGFKRRVNSAEGVIEEYLKATNRLRSGGSPPTSPEQDHETPEMAMARQHGTLRDPLHVGADNASIKGVLLAAQAVHSSAFLSA